MLMRRYEIDGLVLLACITGLMVAIDGAATWWWLHTGIAIEGNPLVSWMVETFGLTIGITVRTVAVLVLLVALVSLRERTRWVGRALALSAVAYSLVVCWHLLGMNLVRS